MRFWCPAVLRLTALISLLAAAVGGSGCGASAGPTSPGTTNALSGQFFSGTLYVGTASSSYTVTVAGPVTISLALVSLADGSNNPLSSPLSLIWGTPSTTDATQCTPVLTQSVSLSLLNAINIPVVAGSYCVVLKDPGTLPIDANFTMRITEVTGALTSVASPIVEAFNTFLQPGATATHTINVAATSTLSVNLTSSGTPPVVLGLAVGSWDGATCRMTTHMNTVGSQNNQAPQISLQVDPGTYCVQVSDIGFVTSNNFSFYVLIGHS
jgi:hypothetical protein